LKRRGVSLRDVQNESSGGVTCDDAELVSPSPTRRRGE
jgi:hypothetical protein